MKLVSIPAKSVVEDAQAAVGVGTFDQVADSNDDCDVEGAVSLEGVRRVAIRRRL